MTLTRATQISSVGLCAGLAWFLSPILQVDPLNGKWQLQSPEKVGTQGTVGSRSLGRQVPNHKNAQHRTSSKHGYLTLTIASWVAVRVVLATSPNILWITVAVSVAHAVTMSTAEVMGTTFIQAVFPPTLIHFKRPIKVIHFDWDCSCQDSWRCWRWCWLLWLWGICNSYLVEVDEIFVVGMKLWVESWPV